MATPRRHEPCPKNLDGGVVRSQTINESHGRGRRSRITTHFECLSCGQRWEPIAGNDRPEFDWNRDATAIVSAKGAFDLVEDLKDQLMRLEAEASAASEARRLLEIALDLARRSAINERSHHTYELQNATKKLRDANERDRLRRLEIAGQSRRANELQKQLADLKAHPPMLVSKPYQTWYVPVALEDGEHKPLALPRKPGEQTYETLPYKNEDQLVAVLPAAPLALPAPAVSTVGLIYALNAQGHFQPCFVCEACGEEITDVAEGRVLFCADADYGVPHFEHRLECLCRLEQHLQSIQPGMYGDDELADFLAALTKSCGYQKQGMRTKG